ncbi:MAG: hypothetical protein EZS28_047046 [Streblomastix strix]|uniref:Uncharacterized protein n=1 Tax=Streblomastix strix TaxID=222440 RepID=A0A5J4TGT3_9EUKA|nr:MAG: hypothetical protein EZS28_047046 [Streblomastix strix]
MRLERGIIPRYQQFEEMRRKLAEQSSYLKGYSEKGRKLRMESVYQALNVVVDDAEKKSVPIAPQMLPQDHPFLLHIPPYKWYQNKVNKMIYSKSQIADIQATRELKSIFDTPWFEEYTEEIQKKNYRNVAKLQRPQINIYEAQVPDSMFDLPELTKQEKKSTLRFSQVDPDYVVDSEEKDNDEMSEFNIEDEMGSNLYDFQVQRKNQQKIEKENEMEKEINLEIIQQQQQTPPPSSQTPPPSSQTPSDKQNQFELRQQSDSQSSPQLIQSETESLLDQSVQSLSEDTNQHTSQQQLSLADNQSQFPRS